MPSIAGYDKSQIAVTINGGSVVAGTVTVPVLIAPYGGLTVTAAKIAADKTISAHATNFATFTLLNGGTVGTATTAIGTAAGTAGTATGIVAATPQAFTLNSDADELTEGQYLMIKYVMAGALADNQFSAIIEYVRGKG